MKRQLMLAATIALTILAIMSLAGCGETEVSTLQEYLQDDKEARQEIQEALAVKMTDDETVEVTYEANAITVTITEGKTHDEELIDGIRLSYEAERDALEASTKEVISEIEESTGITGISIDIVVRNGDGTEIWRNHYTSE